jgi:putative membrane protein
MLTLEPFLKTLLLSLVYSLLGMGVFGLGFLIIRFVSPFSLRKEIEEDQNISLAIVIGSVLLGLSIIIAAAIHG